MILRIIIKIDATRCQIFRLKCTKIVFDWGSAPDPAGGAYDAPPDPVVGWEGIQPIDAWGASILVPSALASVYLYVRGAPSVSVYCANCTKFGQLILRIIIKIDATRCQIFRLKCTKIVFGWGSAPDPAGGASNAPPDPLAGFKGVYF